MLPPADVPPQEAVIPVAQLREALGEGEQRLRRGEGLARLQRPGKIEGAHAHDSADRAGLAALDVAAEAAGIHEHESIAVARILGGLAIAEDDEGVVLMAGHAALGADGDDAVRKMQPLWLPLEAVAAVKMHEIPLAEREIETDGGRLLERDGRLAVILQLGGAGDDVQIGKHAVIQAQREPARVVAQGDGQRFALAAVVKRSREPREGVLPRLDLVRDIAPVRAAVAARRDCNDGGHAVVARAGGGVFLRNRVRARRALHPVLIVVAGKAEIVIAMEIAQIRRARIAPVIEMAQKAELVDLHLVRGGRRAQRQQTG